MNFLGIDPDDPLRNLRRRQRMAAMVGDVTPVIEKPARGAPCNHCGMCCVVKPCWIGRMLFEVEEGECPALQWSMDGGACGLMSNPEVFMPVRVRIEGAGRIREAAKLLIGAGKGCIPGREVHKGVSNKRTRAALKTLGLLKAWLALVARDKPAASEDQLSRSPGVDP